MSHFAHHVLPYASVLIMATGNLAGCSTSSAQEDAKGPSKSAASSAASKSALEQVQNAVKPIKVSAFSTQSIWDDGKAEVAKYAATKSRYGQERRFELTTVAVKESFNPKLLIKSDNPSKEDLSVFKLQMTYVMPTDNYDYHMASTTIVNRENPFALVKMRTTSYELCGITTKYLDLTGSAPTLHSNSYFESEGVQNIALDWPKNGITEEQLLFAVRALPHKKGLTTELNLLSRQLTSHGGKPSWRKGTLTVTGDGPMRDASGNEMQGWYIRVDLEDGTTLSYDVEKASPHRLIGHKAPDGFSLKLKQSARWAYWNFSEPSPLHKAP